MKPSILYFMTTFFVFSFCLYACGQKSTLYDKNLVVKSTELSLATSETRGIEGPSGVVYFVEKDMQTLTAYNKDTIVWKADIGKLFPNPVPGRNEITFIQLQPKTILVTYGKHCFSSVDLINGKVADIGCD